MYFGYPHLYVNNRSHILCIQGRLDYNNHLFTFMKHQEYLKIIERELQRINKVIDYKIIHGIEYSQEARDHKLLLKKIRQNTRTPFFNRLLPRVFQF